MRVTFVFKLYFFQYTKGVNINNKKRQQTKLRKKIEGK